MAGQTVSGLTDVLKEVWTSDRLEKQFYDETPWLSRLERTSKYTIGKQAMVPIHKGRSGATTIRTSAGGALNPLDAQRVDNANYTLSYLWQRVGVEFGVLNQATGGNASVGSGLNLEVEGAVSDLRKSAVRQALSNSDALIAQCTTGGASTTISLLATGYGFDAIARGWLYPGQTVDIGTTANEVAIVADSPISAVSEVAATPTITIGSSVSTTSSHFVSIANARAGAVSSEMNGIRSIAGSTTSGVGGLDPDNAGEEFWQPAFVDTATTVLSLNLLLTLQRKVFQKTGKFNNYVLTGIYQLSNLYELLQNQVRFDNEPTGAGGVTSLKWNGMEINAIPDVPDRELYMLTLDDFLIVTGKYSKPTWASDVQGTNTGLQYNLGNTDFQDAVVYPLQLAIKRRNSHASAIGLTA